MNPIKELIKSHPSFSTIKESDLEYLSHEDIIAFTSKIKNKIIRTAVHGRDDKAFRSDSGESDPYKTTVLVNPPSPGYRGSPAGAKSDVVDMTDQNDLEGKRKSTKPKGKTETRIDELLNISKERYLLRLTLNEDIAGTQELAERIYGKGAKTDGKSVFIEIAGEDEARHIMNQVRGSMMERI